MDAHTRISVEDIVQHFAELEDPRSAINQRPLAVVDYSLMTLPSNVVCPSNVV